MATTVVSGGAPRARRYRDPWLWRTCAIAGLAVYACSNPTVIDTSSGNQGGAGGNGGNHSGGGGGGGIVVTISSGGSTGTTVGINMKNCGNGVLDKGEGCDDGVPPSKKIKSTDNPDPVTNGCTAICQIESGWSCPTAGQPCVDERVCGNGVLTPNKECDDGNTKSGDGCSSDCKLEKGYRCRLPGKPCAILCGDGVANSPEQCDDGNTANGDGCSAGCKVESGYACSGTPSVCKKTTCGDGKVEGSEGCDLGTGKNLPGSGCSPTCHFEPNCSASSGQCTSKCGDGLVVGEGCDDGNTTPGDGCSPNCKVEAGFQCSQPDANTPTMTVPVVYRDFLDAKDKTATGHPDFFENDAQGQNVPVPGLVAATLDNEGKPVYAGTATSKGNITSADTFKQWYRDVKGVNTTYVSTLLLHNNGTGSYVNWWKDDQQFTKTSCFRWCSSATCAETPPDNRCNAPDPGCVAGPAEICVPGCTGAPFTAPGCKATQAKVDGNPLFFPLDKVPGMITPAASFGPGELPPLYSGTQWVFEPGGAAAPKHNFSFTSEVRYWFTYQTNKKYILDFTGDDDVWVFVNRKLAVDLGGIHTPVEGHLELNATGGGTVTITPTGGAACKKEGDIASCTPYPPQKVDLGMTNNGVYEIVVFQAERAWWGSTYRLTLSGFNDAASGCVPACGDGVAVAGEECDCGDGKGTLPAGCPGPNNDTSYGGCTTKCTWGPFCGDGVVNGDEQCDIGKDNGTDLSPTGCTFQCKKPHYCGDGILDTNLDEECDMGPLNGKRLDTSGNPTDDDTGSIWCNPSCKIDIIPL